MEHPRAYTPFGAPVRTWEFGHSWELVGEGGA